MNKKFVRGLAFGLILLLVGLTGYVVTSRKTALAASAGDVDGAILHIKAEITADHGATWLNFGGTEASANQTATVTPGQELEFRIKVWNTGNVTPRNVRISGSVTNSSFVTGLVVVHPDLDADGNLFNGFTFSAGGTGTVLTVLAGTTEEVGFQGMQGTIQLASSFPAGETVLLGQVVIDDYAIVAQNPLFFINKAMAAGVGNNSSVRLAINVAGATPTPSVTTLPATGGGVLNVDQVRTIFTDFANK